MPWASCAKAKSIYSWENPDIKAKPQVNVSMAHACKCVAGRHCPTLPPPSVLCLPTHLLYPGLFYLIILKRSWHAWAWCVFNLAPSAHAACCVFPGRQALRSFHTGHGMKHIPFSNTHACMLGLRQDLLPTWLVFGKKENGRQTGAALLCWHPSPT